MPLHTCPVNEKTLAEYALGPGRSRLSPEELLRVERHLDQCDVCRKDLEGYRDCARVELPAAEGRDIAPELVVSTQNVMTRLQADLALRANEHARKELDTRWRLRSILTAAVGVLAAGLAFFFFSPTAPAMPPGSSTRIPPSPETGGITPGTPPEATARDLPTNFAIGERRRAKDDMERVAERLKEQTPDGILAVLAETRDAVQKESPDYAAAALGELAKQYEAIFPEFQDGEREGKALLEWSRTLLAGGDRRAWLTVLERYAAWKGRTAYTTAVEDKNRADAPALARRAEHRAEAAAYFDEAKYWYDAKEYVAALALCDRLITQYADTGKAYEGQTIAARAYVANQQPSQAVGCFQRIVEHCPDERFAREAAKTYLSMLAQLDRSDEVADEANRLAERFRDDDFRGYALVMAGEARMKQGERHYPEAVRLFRQVKEIRADSTHAVKADKNLGVLRRRMASGV